LIFTSLRKVATPFKGLSGNLVVPRIPDYSLTIAGTLLGLTTKKKTPIAAR
jgi:hypothetical protein